MVKKKACKKCKLFVDGDICPSCKSTQFTTNFQGRIFILDPKASTIAEKMGIDAKGEYAIKIR
jgi:DNA-directed RNA polymerase subunit E"